MSDQTKPDGKHVTGFVPANYKEWAGEQGHYPYVTVRFNLPVTSDAGDFAPVVLLDPRYVDWIREVEGLLRKSKYALGAGLERDRVLLLAQLDALEKERGV